LNVDEGLTGLALKELRPIRTGFASRSPAYKYIPDSYEEQYESYLAAPILRGLTRIGVLVVQDTQRDYFDENDGKALLAIAAQLATTIENAKLFMSVHERIKVVDDVSEPDATSAFFKGISGSPGMAAGRATVIGQMDSYLRLTTDMEQRHCTLEEFEEALTRSQQQIEELQLQLEHGLSDIASLIFSAHLLVLKDTEFTGAMIQQIQSGQSPQLAVSSVVNQYVALFATSANPRLREKVQDIKDVGHRLLHNLLMRDDVAPDYAGEIVISGELLPSDIVKLSTQHAAGLVMHGSGVTSHVSILARSMNLPLVLVSDNRIFNVSEGAHVLMDANVGTVFIDPGPEITVTYEEAVDAHRRAESAEMPPRAETYTVDGERVRLLANINLLNELPLAQAYQAEGVGLYRSEFPFIVRNGFPSEEEQYRIYRSIIDGMSGRPVTLRTLDIGGDKILSYYPAATEANPFLGLRAIRFSLRNPELFAQQIRAMLRSGEGADLGIMFPMISSVDEFVTARTVVHACIGQLAEQGVPHQEHPRIGAMIELPSAVEVVDELAQEADFLSLGTNDLVQYILAIDRTNEMLADLYVPFHPAVLRSLKRVAVAAAMRGTPLSVCGDMASDARMISFLIGIGLREFSLELRSLPRIQSVISRIDSRRANEQAKSMLSIGRIDELERFLAGQADL
jgi:phosphotransferase system enzyme I (PtsP)